MKKVGPKTCQLRWKEEGAQERGKKGGKKRGRKTRQERWEKERAQLLFYFFTFFGGTADDTETRRPVHSSEADAVEMVDARCGGGRRRGRRSRKGTVLMHKIGLFGPNASALKDSPGLSAESFLFRFFFLFRFVLFCLSIVGMNLC